MTSRNVPRLRFKEFRDEWQEDKIQNVGTIKAGGDAKKSDILLEGKYPVIANNLTNDGIIGYYNEVYKVDYPCVTVTARGTIGIPKARNYKFTPVGRLIVFKSSLQDEFLENVIKTIRIFNESTGVPQLTGPQFGKYYINYPSLPEQQHIGNFFSKLDHLIDLHSQKLEQLKKLKRGYLQKMFPQKGETVPRLQFSGFSGEWKEESLDKLVSIRTGNKNAEDDIPDGNYVFFDRSSEIKHLNSYDFDGKVIVYPGEGANFIPRKYEGKYSLHQRAYGLYDFRNINSEYLYQYLLTQNHTFLKYAVGTTSKSLRGICFKKVIVPCSSIEEQQRIAGLFSRIDNCIDSTDEKIHELKKQKKAYLQKMFI